MARLLRIKYKIRSLYNYKFMAEKIFANGLMFKRPNEKAPDFVKGSLSIKTDEFIKFLNENSSDGWVNLDLKESQNGKLYFELNTWKPEDKFVKKGDKIAVEPREEDEEEHATSITF